MERVTAEITGYHSVQEIHRSESTLVLRARRSSDGLAVILKALAPSSADPSARKRLRHEHQILHDLGVPGVPRALRLCSTALGMTLEIEDAGGAPLHAPEGGLPVGEILAVASTIARIVAAIHARGVTHRDLSPGNILRDAGPGGAIHVLDFGSATRLSQETRERPRRLEGTLGYLSPEQTGRMNRPVDRRADLYALGAVIYHLAVGRPPFVAQDPLELIHATVARVPLPLHELRPEIPRPLSRVVSKLLSKMAEDRYQSADGLAADLEAFAACWEARGEIPEMPLGAADRFDLFALPDKLYGRDLELSVLVSATAKARRGAPPGPRAVAVLGPAGVGKTALVHELRRALGDGGGLLAAGKFDQLQRAQPYAAVLQALRGLVQTILAESEASMAAWRRRLLDALGPNGALVLDAIPELAPIIGPQPPALALPPAEARRRFLRVIVAFLHAFHAPDHPLALFLDDLQWADAASLELLEDLLTEPRDARATLLLSWRSGEVDAEHPLTAVLKRVPEGALQRLELGPLGVDDIADLIVDTLAVPRHEAAELGALVLAKTEGNPFFVREFLRALHARGALPFDPIAGRRRWNADEIRQLAITDNVVELLARRLRELPDEAREALSVGACIGNRFDVSILAVASRRTRSEAARALWPAVLAGLLLPTEEIVTGALSRGGALDLDEAPLLDGALAFAHDRVQQAAYELLSRDEARRAHLEIGRLLLAHFEDGDDRVFDILAQLDVGLDLIRDPAERRRVAELNLLAGRKAAASAAFGAALTYFEAGLSLLPADAWRSAYGLAIALHLGAGEAALACPDRPTAIDYVEAALANASKLLDKVEAQDIRIKHHISRCETVEAVARTVEALRWLGVSMPERPTRAHVAAELGRTWWRLRGFDLDALRALPPMKDEAMIAATRLLLGGGASAFYVSSNLMPLFLLRMVNLSLDHGVSKYSAYGFVGYAFILTTRLDDVAGGERHSTFARELVARFDAAELRARVEYTYYAFIHFRTRAMAAAIDVYPPLYHQGVEAGDLEAASQVGFAYANRSFLAGVELEEVDDRCARQIEAMRRIGQTRNVLITLVLRQVVANLRGQARDPARLDGEHVQAAPLLQKLVEANDRSIRCLYQYQQCMVAVLGGELELAAESAAEGDALLSAAKGAPQLGLLNMYAAIARAGLARRRGGWEAKRLLRAARGNVAAIAKWAKDAPMNFLHHQRLAEAEIAAAEGRDGDAAKLYDEAIALARSTDAAHETALGLERAARFYLARGRHRSVGPYLAEARAAWTQWGALSRLPALAALEAELRSAYTAPAAAAAPPSLRTPAVSGLTMNDAELDLSSVMKASRAVSGELVLRRLSERLMRVILESAGARRGILVIALDGDLRIAARGRVTGAEVTVEVPPAPVPIAALDPADVCASKLLQYVARTREPLLSDGEGGRTLRELVGDGAPLSALCLPLVKAEGLVGLLYLDNDLTAGAFTASRMELIGVLAAQATLSIQNAVLYEKLEEHSRDLERKVEDRTRDLKSKNEELGRALGKLRETQAQLVVQERLASLGALTAGIAHEIKNPLNFISNFAEVSAEMADDLAASLAPHRDRLDEDTAADVDDLIGSLRENVTKINEHGRRAGRIIDGMLAHSQGATGEREAADLDALVAECVDLGRQRARAKHLGFELTVTADYAAGAELDLSPPDIRRVLLSVIDNACYAMQKKRGAPGYTPRLEVRTRALGDRVEVRVGDNGAGIPPAVADKVWNPFFTTKPTGEGTGLGLSIAHEIIVRGHGGEIRFTSTEGEGTAFVIELPTRASGAKA